MIKRMRELQSTFSPPQEWAKVFQGNDEKMFGFVKNLILPIVEGH
jgi:hypothetical protein